MDGICSGGWKQQRGGGGCYIGGPYNTLGPNPPRAPGSPDHPWDHFSPGISNVPGGWWVALHHVVIRMGLYWIRIQFVMGFTGDGMLRLRRGAYAVHCMDVQYLQCCRPFGPSCSPEHANPTIHPIQYSNTAPRNSRTTPPHHNVMTRKGSQRNPAANLVCGRCSRTLLTRAGLVPGGSRNEGLVSYTTEVFASRR